MRPPLAASALLIFNSIALFMLAQSAALAVPSTSPITPPTAAGITRQHTADTSNKHEITSDWPLQTIVVTASRIKPNTSRSLAQTTSFDTQAIAASSAIDLPALLPFSAGAQVVRSGGLGSSNSFYLRGANATQTLILMDGVRLDSASLGSAQLGQLMLDQIERVEVVNGNVSALYGSHAIGGVVQIFTKQGKPATPRFSFSTESGSYHTHKQQAAVSGALDKAGDTTFHLSWSHLRTDSFSPLNPRKVPNANPHAHGFNHTNFGLSLRQRLNADWYAGVHFFDSQGTFDFNNAYDAPTDTNRANNRLRVFSTSIAGPLSDAWTTQLIAAKSEDQNINLLNHAFNGRFNTTNHQFTWQNELALTDWQKILFGYEYFAQRLSADAYAAPVRQVHSHFAGYQTEFGAHQFQFNLRRDAYADFGTPHSYYAAYGYTLNRRWKFITSLSNAFRAPSFNDLYYPGYGNPKLRPEHSHSAEVAVQYTYATLGTIRVTAFQTNFRDLIESIQVTPGLYHAQNVGRAKVQGLETSLESRWLQHDIRFTATLQNPVDQKRNTILPRRARHFAALSVVRPVAGWRVGGEWLVSGARDDSGMRLGGYGVVNLSARYNLNKAWYIAARVENLLNKQYELAYAYQTPQRSAYLMLGWQPH